MSRPTRLIVLCEDIQQEIFARHFLLSCGFKKARIRYKTGKKGSGSAEQFVRKQLPQYVIEYRKRRREDVGLVVIIDADKQTVEHHFRELETALTQAGQKARQPDERIGIYIPRRNIETWIYYLQGNAVDEETDYKPRVSPNNAKPAAEALAEKRRQPLPDDAPHSLHTACGELSRILP